MDMIEKHRAFRKKPIVYYNLLLNKYHRNSPNELFIVCEGNADLSYYGEIIEHRFPEKKLEKIPVECKNNVIDIYKRMDWSVYQSKRVLFFVDRDLSYWVNEPQYYGDNVYITDGYSFENDAVNEHMFIKCLQDFYGFNNYTTEERNMLCSIYKKYWGLFEDGAYELMACALLDFAKTREHKSSKIKIRKCISFSTELLWNDRIGNQKRLDYFKSNYQLEDDSMDEIEKIIERFKSEYEYYSIRGKWCIEFLSLLLEYVMDNAKEFTPSLFDGEKKEPKRLLGMNGFPERGVMSILGPKIIPPVSLDTFLTNNLLRDEHE